MALQVLGIDPGLKGGLALVRSDGAVESVFPMPVIKNPYGENGDIVDVSIKYHIPGAIAWANLIVIELQQARPGNSIAAMSTSQRNYGRLLASIEHFRGSFDDGYRVVIVEPRDWQRCILMKYLACYDKKDPKRTKKAAIAYCGDHFPDISLLSTKRCTTPHDGMADALCIARYGIEQELLRCWK